MSDIKNIKQLLDNLGFKHYSDEGIDQEQLSKGMEVEKEHTAEPAMVEKIVRDHLAEDPKYYSKLKVMEDGETGDTKTS